MEKIEVTEPMARTLETIFQFWSRQYRELWQNIQSLHKRNPNQKEIKVAFAELCERHAGISFYFGLPKDTFVNFAFELKEKLKQKTKKIKNQNQYSLDFSESRPKGRVTLTGSLDEQLRVTTGFSATRNAKKYKKVKIRSFGL